MSEEFLVHLGNDPGTLTPMPENTLDLTALAKIEIDAYLKAKNKDVVESIEGMLEAIDRLPPHAMMLPVTQYDHYSILLLLLAALRSED
jgi:hypothetical protein